MAELTGAYGLGGRPRRAGDPAEKARTTVTSRIRDAIGRVETVHPDLGRHLRASVRTGTFCVVPARAVGGVGGARGRSHIVRRVPTPEECQHPVRRGRVMSFLQIITFATDRFDEFVALEHAWSEETAGRRTNVGAQVFADRDRPGHYVALDWFDSPRVGHGQLAPPGDRRLRPAGRRAARPRGPTSGTSSPSRPRGTPVRRRSAPRWRSSTVAPHTFADDVDLDILVPHGRMRVTGRAALEESLRAEASGSRHRGVEQPRNRGRLRRRVRLPHAREPLPGRRDHGGHPEGRSRSSASRSRAPATGRPRPRHRSSRRPEPSDPHPRECPMTAEEVEVTGAVTERLFGAAARRDRAGDGAPRGPPGPVRRPGRATHRRRPGAGGRHRRAVRPRVARAAGHQRAGQRGRAGGR